MSGSVFGNHFKISTWGESHGEALGVVIDGCPAGLSLCKEDIQIYLDRRKPGNSKYSTSRKESDQAVILSGVFHGKTTGTPICITIKNEAQRSQDYSEISSYYRPGHADYTYDQKYGFRDYRGGGRSSGRETIGRVAAGAVALKILSELSVTLCTYTRSIGSVTINDAHFDQTQIEKNDLCMPDQNAADKASTFLNSCMEQNDSAGGVIECRIKGLPAGIGEPVFDKLDACLAKAIVSIGAVKAFEVGIGHEAAALTGLQNNDAFIKKDETIAKRTNHAGGILGGISDGDEIVLRCTVKPTPSVATLQHTVNQNGEEIEVSVKGRHDPVIVPRAVVVVESMAAITLVDLLFENMHANMNLVKQLYLK